MSRAQFSSELNFFFGMLLTISSITINNLCKSQNNTYLLVNDPLKPLFLPSSFGFLSYFILAVPMLKCLGKHSCMSSHLLKPYWMVLIRSGKVEILVRKKMLLKKKYEKQPHSNLGWRNAPYSSHIYAAIPRPRGILARHNKTGRPNPGTGNFDT